MVFVESLLAQKLRRFRRGFFPLQLPPGSLQLLALLPELLAELAILLAGLLGGHQALLAGREGLRQVGLLGRLGLQVGFLGRILTSKLAS